MIAEPPPELSFERMPNSVRLSEVTLLALGAGLIVTEKRIEAGKQGQPGRGRHDIDRCRTPVAQRPDRRDHRPEQARALHGKQNANMRMAILASGTDVIRRDCSLTLSANEIATLSPD